jgi:hypothetical protein
LFSVPVIFLEPINFVAAYLAATGNFLYAIATFVVGELLKLVMIERLFELTRKKLFEDPGIRICVRTLPPGANLDPVDRSSAGYSLPCDDRVRVWQHDLSGLPSRFLASDTPRDCARAARTFLALNI